MAKYGRAIIKIVFGLVCYGEKIDCGVDRLKMDGLLQEEEAKYVVY